MPREPFESVQEVLLERYGLRVTTRKSADNFEMGLAIAQIVPSNPRRLSLIMINLSANSIWIAPETFVAPAHGIMLVPNGGTFILNYREDLTLASHAWAGIADGANSDMYWLEACLY